MVPSDQVRFSRLLDWRGLEWTTCTPAAIQCQGRARTTDGDRELQSGKELINRATSLDM
jgi:hypothetical protein